MTPTSFLNREVATTRLVYSYTGRIHVFYVLQNTVLEMLSMLLLFQRKNDQFRLSIKIPEVGVPLVECGLAPGEEEQEEDGGAQQDARVVDLPHHWPGGTPESISVDKTWNFSTDHKELSSILALVYGRYAFTKNIW